MGDQGDNTLHLTANWQPGTELAASVPELSERILLDVQLADKDGVLVTNLQSLESVAGTSQGQFTWAHSNKSAPVRITLNHRFAPDYRPEIVSLTGPTTTLNATGTLQDASLTDATLALETPNWKITGSNIQSDLNNRLSADISVIGDPEILTDLGLPDTVLTAIPTGENLTTSGMLNYTPEHLTLDKLRVALGNALTLQGETKFGLTDQSLNADLTGSIASALVRAFLPELTSSEPIGLALNTKGNLQDLSINATVDSPAIAYAENSFPPARLTLRAAGLPETPSGQITLRSSDETYSGNAGFTSTADTFSLSELDYRGPNFQLYGRGQFANRNTALDVDLSYTGQRGAMPFPGMEIIGEVSVQGSLSPSDNQNPGPNAIVIRSDDLRLNDLRVVGLNSTLEGSIEDLSIAGDIAALTQGQQSLLSDSQFSTTLDTSASQFAVRQFSGTLLDLYSVKTNKPALIGYSEGLSVKDFDLAINDAGRVLLTGDFTDRQWQAELDVQQFPLTANGDALDFTANLDTSQDLAGSGLFSIATIQADQPLALAGTLSWDKQTLTIRDQNNDPQRQVRLDLPVALVSTSPIQLSTEGNISGRVLFESTMDAIAAAMPNTLQGMEGLLSADLTIGGTFDTPELEGDIELQDGAFTDVGTGLSLIGMHARLSALPNSSAQGSKFEFDAGARGAGQSGDDRLTLKGSAEFGQAHDIQLNITMDDLLLKASPIEKLATRGNLTFASDLNQSTLTGDIIIDDIDITVAPPPQTGLIPINVVRTDETSPTEPSDAPSTSTPLNLKTDLTISADDRIFINGRGLTSEWKATLNVQSGENGNLILGTINLVRGTFDFSGRRFDLTEGDIVFDRLSVNDPVIKLRAEYETSSEITAAVTASGRVSQPRVELTSTPERPANDVMALVLFGKPAEELSAVESLQTAQALASLGGIGPFGGGGNFMGGLRRATGLDLLNVDFDPSQGASALTVGKYLADGLFVSATQDVRGQNGSVRVEYELRKNITVETDIRQNGDQQVSANWKRDF